MNFGTRNFYELTLYAMVCYLGKLSQRRIESTLEVVAVVTCCNAVQWILGVLACYVTRNQMIPLKLNPIFRRSASIEATVLAYATLFCKRVEPTTHELRI
jgi:hypothetical protein